MFYMIYSDSPFQAHSSDYDTQSVASFEQPSSGYVRPVRRLQRRGLRRRQQNSVLWRVVKPATPHSILWNSRSKSVVRTCTDMQVTWPRTVLGPQSYGDSGLERWRSCWRAGRLMVRTLVTWR